MNVLPQELESLLFTRAAGFSDEHGETIEFGLNLGDRKELRSRGKNGSLDNRVFRAVEAEEFADGAAVDHATDDFGALLSVIERFYAECVPATGVGKYWAIHGFNGQKRWQRLGLSHGGLCHEKHIVGDVKHSFAGSHQVVVSR